MKLFSLRCIKHGCAALSLAPLAVGFTAFSVLVHDVTGPQRFDSRTISNLALAALIVPGLASLPLAAASEAADEIAFQQGVR